VKHKGKEEKDQDGDRVRKLKGGEITKRCKTQSHKGEETKVHLSTI